MPLVQEIYGEYTDDNEELVNYYKSKYHLYDNDKEN